MGVCISGVAETRSWQRGPGPPDADGKGPEPAAGHPPRSPRVATATCGHCQGHQPEKPQTEAERRANPRDGRKQRTREEEGTAATKRNQEALMEQRLSRKQRRGSGVCRLWFPPATGPGDPLPRGCPGLGRGPGPTSNQLVTIWAASLPRSLVHSPLPTGSTPGTLRGSQGALTVTKPVDRFREKSPEDFHRCWDAL